EMKRIISKSTRRTRNANSTPEEPSNPAPRQLAFPPGVARQRRDRGVKALRCTSFLTLSTRERAEHDDPLKMMNAMAYRKKAAAVYFAMSEAMSIHRGRPLSDQELVEAHELNRALG